MLPFVFPGTMDRLQPELGQQLAYHRLVEADPIVRSEL
jgi:hypothetical protein